MEQHVRYTIVGTTVLAALIGFAIFTAWIMGGLDDKEYDYYTILFKDAIGGIKVNSPVDYKGVEVGQVTDILLDAENPEVVQINIKVVKDVPMQADTDVSLGVPGITGASHVQLSTDFSDAPEPVPMREGYMYPVLEGHSLQISRILEDIPRITSNLVDISNRINTLIDDDLANDIRGSVANLQQVSTDMQRVFSPEHINDISAILGNTKAATQDFATISNRVNSAVSEIEVLASQLSEAIEENQSSIGKFANQGLDQFLALTRESRQMAEEISKLAESLSENPSRLIYKQQDNTVKIAP